MPTPPPAGFRLGAIRPTDAINAFAQRGLLLPSFRWQEIWQDEHARGFAVAGVMRLDVLALIRQHVAEAVEKGLDLDTFRNGLRGQLARKGYWGDVEITDPSTGEMRTTRFDERRLELIFQTNMRQSQAAGRWVRGMRSRVLTHIQYRTMGDHLVRKEHQAWDNLVLPREHPFWHTHLPPNGWRCRCTFGFIDQEGMDRLRDAGIKLKTEAPEVRWVEFLNKVTGRTERVPRGIDPGFAYNPGMVGTTKAVERLDTALATVAPTPPGAGNAQALTRGVVARMRSEKGFKQFLAHPPKGAVGMPVAAVPALPGEPPVASVAASALRAQAARGEAGGEFPLRLPLQAAQWALAQAIIDEGQRVDLPNGNVLWWWVRGSKVMVLELERTALVWWTKALMTLTRDEAVAAYAALGKVI